MFAILLVAAALISVECLSLKPFSLKSVQKSTTKLNEVLQCLDFLHFGIKFLVHVMIEFQFRFQES